MDEEGFCLRVVGVTYPNRDGSSRQDEIGRCVVGEAVELYRERTNRFDPSAVAVYSRRDVQLGYVGADRCGWIGSKVDRGYEVACIVDRITGGGAGWLGLVLRIRIAGGELPPLRSARAGDPVEHLRLAPAARIPARLIAGGKAT